MARITIEDCLEKVDNRFSLVHLAARRVRQLKKGAPVLVKAKNREVVIALREIAAGLITPEVLKQIDEVTKTDLEVAPEEFEELEI
jgi:DNA-directed RNA polymerase subunit omega